MARTKKYNEDEVIEKAMKLFWKNGYENTSMQMLEKEMGINKFSIYSSFGNKHGVFLESIKSYKNKVRQIFLELENSADGIDAIKKFFYNSIKIYDTPGNQKGCLITNTYYEFATSDDQIIKDQMSDFMNNLKEIFIQKLKKDTSKDHNTIQKQANYLLLAKHGLATTSKISTIKEVEDYIELVFKNI